MLTLDTLEIIEQMVAEAKRKEGMRWWPTGWEVMFERDLADVRFRLTGKRDGNNTQ